MSNQRLASEVERLIEEGQRVLDTKRQIHTEFGRDELIDPTLLARWLPGCRNLLRMLGPYAGPWSEPFAESASYYGWWRAQQMQSALQSILDAVKHDLLLDTEDLILAETFTNLLDQAIYLHREGYFLAAGVLGRAVLEEHLRKWAQHAKCIPTQPKPQIAHYTQSLYADKQFNVIALKHIEAMAAIGNDAAHNKSGLKSEDVARLLGDVKEFLTRHPLAVSVT